jgi:hypothetical protein
VEYFAGQDVCDLSVSIDVDSLDGARVTTLYSGFLNQSFRVTSGAGVLRCSVPGLPLRPDTYSLNVMLGTDHECADFVRGIRLLTVGEADVYGTGRLPDRSQGALLPQYSWELVPAPSPAALPPEV